ncbi:DMT family transporter [Parendozoicomonas haliclonae]|uniref:Aromatic amino acid exporter n=1 Tax=Parendozoicomonas haliclonae TaxID=1960125 RepID=A0A1X7AFM5_9GAMM|nr:DMT family transporter [Parendozoicomonas haliclonae]SMA37805.1 aromatic amino acid exporter [Parendozoicomonas haliclonae]
MTNQKNQKLALLCGLATVLLWSTVASAFKISLMVLTPLQLVSGAAIVSLAALLVSVSIRGQLPQVIRALKQRPLFYLALGALNPTAYYLALFAGYDRLPAQIASPVNYTWAVLLPLLAAPILKQALTRWQLMGCLVGYLGVAVIATRGEFNGLNNVDPLGLGLILVSAVLWCLYWILNTGNKEDAIVSLCSCTLCSLPMLLIINIIQGDWPTLTAGALAGAAYVGLFEMGITSMLWLQALKTAENTSQISSLAFLSPLLSIIWISTVLGETIHPTVYPGMALILIGMAITQWADRRRAVPSAA